MLNSDGILELLEDEFGAANTQLFCEMYARFCDLSSSDKDDWALDLSADKYVYEVAAQTIKNRIYSYTIDRESLRGLKTVKKDV